MIKRFMIFLLPLFMIYSCQSGGEADADFQIPDSIANDAALEVSEEAMEDIVQNISSPVEMAALIKSMGVPYSNKYLATTDNTDDLNTSFDQALALGIFGADLGYLNMYNKTTTVLDYIGSISKLADKLKVGQFFDFSTLKRLATNNTNLDSLMYISVHSFNQMDDYLRENNRSSLSSLIVAGVWIEGLFLATQVAKENPGEAIAERIGEQKLMLADLLLILKNYKKDPNFAELIVQFERIKEEFEDVRITYEKGEPQAIEQDGMLMIIQNDKSIVHITEAQLKSIIAVTEEVRNEITGN